ncbi:MAG: hypothetical protein RL095_987 [Verrucomicrobiota bacterium]|jgi:dTDP-glucose pyrophosphorylase
MTAQVQGDLLRSSMVKPSASLAATLRAMKAECALVINGSGVLVGMVTDGDIRRAFLGGASLETPIEQVMTRDPIRVGQDATSEDVLRLMVARKIRQVPVVDELGRPVALELFKDRLDEDGVAEAVVMAGGRGQRLMPLTQDTPKPLLKVGDQTILDDILGKLRRNGVKDVVLTVGYLADKIREHIGGGDSHDLHVNYVQEETALGTAGALALLDPKPQHPFLVMNGDLLTELDFRALSAFHQESGNAITMCVRRFSYRIPYGVVRLEPGSHSVEGIDEKPEIPFLVNAGIYMLDPEVIELIPKGRFYDMVSLMNQARGLGRKVGAFPILEYWKDIGQHTEIAEADRYCRAKLAAAAMSAAVYPFPIPQGGQP